MQPIQLAEKIDTLLKRSVPYGFSGGALVSVAGEVILNKGYGMADRERLIPNTERTVFDTGSINKSFTAIAIMQLESGGLLNTSDTLPRFFEDVPPDKVGVSLHHLLTHTSGVVDFVGHDDFDPMPPGEVLARIMSAPLNFEPGSEYRYSNHGYTLLGMIVEQLSGQNYRDYMRNNVFLPAGMTTAGWYGERHWREDHVAHGYTLDKDAGSPYEWPSPGWVLLASGGIVCTMEDLYKAHLALQGDALLSEEARRRMYTPFLNDYAYGWEVSQTERGTTLIEHDGASMYGFSASFRHYVDEGVVVALACNSDYHGQVMIRLLEDKLESVIFGGSEVVVPPPLATPDLGQSRDLASLVGAYKFGSGHLNVREGDGHLLIEPVDQQAINELAFPPEQHASLLAWRDHIDSLARNALSGMLAPPLKMLLRPERADYYQQYLSEELQKASEEAGDLGAVLDCEAVGILPMMGFAVATVRLRRERGAQMIRWVWTEEGLRGLIPIWSDDPSPLAFVGSPAYDGDIVTIVAYHLGADRIINLRLDPTRGEASLLRGGGS